MAVTTLSSGSQTAVISTEHTLGTDPAVAGTFTLHVDAINMATSDALELRIYQKILTV